MTPGSLAQSGGHSVGAFVTVRDRPPRTPGAVGQGETSPLFVLCGCVFTSNELANLTLKANFRCDWKQRKFLDGHHSKEMTLLSPQICSDSLKA